jgi:prevent-host-death family protein
VRALSAIRILSGFRAFSPMPRGGRRMRFCETKPKLLARLPAALSYDCVAAILELDLKNPYITDMTDNQERPRSIVTSAEFQRNLGLYQDKALAEPVIITKNGRERLVLVSVEEYHRLKRRALAVEDLSAEQIAALERARMPKGHEHLDAELKDWRP